MQKGLAEVVALGLPFRCRTVVRWIVPCLLLLGRASPALAIYGQDSGSRLDTRTGTPPGGNPKRPTPPKVAVTPPKTTGKTWKVKPGDTLWAIAAKECGSGAKWKAIWEANKAKVRNPNLIYPGQELAVRCDASGAGTDPKTGAPGSAAPGKGTPGSPGSGKTITTRFQSPLPAGSYRVSSGFGPRKAPVTGDWTRGSTNHQGVDLAAPAGTPISAAADGIVTFAGYGRGYGWMVTIRHADGSETRYGHMRSAPPVRVGQAVAAGARIGAVGSTGNSSGPHLHFEVRDPQGRAVDPKDHCRF